MDWRPLKSSPGSENSALKSTSYPLVKRRGLNNYSLEQVCALLVFQLLLALSAPFTEHIQLLPYMQDNIDVQFIASRLPWYGPSHSPDGLHPAENTRFTSFYDIAGITEDPVAFRKVVELLVRRYKAASEAGYGPTKIAGFEPRGFIFGTAVAVQLGIPFVMIGEPNT